MQASISDLTVQRALTLLSIAGLTLVDVRKHASVSAIGLLDAYSAMFSHADLMFVAFVLMLINS